MGFYELLNEFLSGKGEITIRVRGEPTGFKIELSLGHPLGETDSEQKQKEIEERMPLPESPETHRECLPEMEKGWEDKGRGERSGIEANGHRNASGFSGGSGLWGFEKLGPITSTKKKRRPLPGTDSTTDNGPLKPIEVPGIQKKEPGEILAYIREGLEEIRSRLYQG